jgi:hypothetical protein
MLALFYESPALALATWTGHLSASHRLSLASATNDANSALSLWGFDHTAIAIGLMPAFLIAADQLLAIDQPRRARGVNARSVGGWTAVAAASGLLVSWLHPWQGLILLAVVAALVVIRPPRRRYLVLAAPTLATLLPLIYGVVLTRSDASWRAFQAQTMTTGTVPAWALLASLGPLVALAALGVRKPGADREWMLSLWPLAGAGVYFLVPQFPPHALAGVTLPLAVLAVRGWERVRERAGARQRLAAPVSAAALLVFTVPAVVYHAQGLADDTSRTPRGAFAQALFRLTPQQAAALAYIGSVPRAGGVLAPWLLSMSVPELTGRGVYAGHQQWQPARNIATSEAFFDRKLNDPAGALRRAIVRRSRASFVLADCGAPADLGRAIAPLARPVKRFGCVIVYETN